MWLPVPDKIEHVLWERTMELAPEETSRQLVRGDRESPNVDVRDLPIVSIGQPEVWPLVKVYPPEKMLPLLQPKLTEADFYLVRFACSFRPCREGRIVWARFLARLLPDETSSRPIAYDLHPHRVTQEVKRNVRVTLSPTLKFLEVEAAAGELAFGFEYLEIQPFISAAGVGEAIPSWDYEETKGMMVQGSKFMHLLLKTPSGMETVKARLDIVADVKVQGGVLSVLLGGWKASDQLTVPLVSID